MSRTKEVVVVVIVSVSVDVTDRVVEAIEVVVVLTVVVLGVTLRQEHALETRDAGYWLT
jgi:hypothetical protein